MARAVQRILDMMLTGEDIPNVKAHSDKAYAYYAERFGARGTVGRQQAIDYIRHGWGLASFATVEELARAFDCVVGCELPIARKATFPVAYDRGAGHSAGGSSVGSRPVSCSMFARADVDAWAERALIRFGCSKTEADHYGR